jgi:hypothetical protein
MKKQIFAIAACVVLAGFAPALCHAQDALRSTVPFAFQASDKTMPAGEYDVQRAMPHTPTLLKIQSRDLSHAVFVATNGADGVNKDAQAKLVFHCYAGECFLSQVWTGSQGRQLLPSRREKEVSRAKSENELAVVVVPLTSARP